MELAYATSFNSEDIRNWSGLGVYYEKMLRGSGFADLNCLNLHKKPLLNGAISLFKKNIALNLLGHKVSPIFNISKSKTFAKIIENKIEKGTHILSPNTVILAHLKKDLKKILYTDSTLDNLLHFYSNYCNLHHQAVLEAQELERLTIENSDLLIYTSQWAADSAIKNYKADAKKVFIVPFGANLNSTPSYQELKSIVGKKDISKHINLLFIGVEWKRKGGEYAVKVTRKLNQMGISTSLHVAGFRNLASYVGEKFVVDHGFISKRTVNDEMKLCNLIAKSDFLILPSVADCTPVVFSEANAFGVPCLVSQVGGHTGIIKDGINGKTFLRPDFVENCVKYISDLVERKNSYRDLCFSSYNEYSNELNWKSAGTKIFKLIQSI
jgi:glycosyltransferase involved in cell wall biosynthesis